MQIIIGQVFIYTLNNTAARHQSFKLICNRTACILNKGTYDGIVAGVFPITDRSGFRISLQFQHIIHNIPRAVNIKITEMVAIIPFPDIVSLFRQTGVIQQLVNLALYKTKILVQTGICDRIRHKIICSSKDALFCNLQTPRNNREPKCLIVLQCLHQAFHNIEHFIIVTVVVRFCYGNIILIYKKNYRLFIIALHHRCQKHKAALNFFYRTAAMCEMCKRRFLEVRGIFTIKQIEMSVVQICNHHCEHIVCPSEIQSIYLSKRNKNCRILVHPRIAQCLVFCNFQSLKQFSALLADVEEAFQHAHAQCLAEAPGTGNKRYFYPRSAEQLSY